MVPDVFNRPLGIREYVKSFHPEACSLTESALPLMPESSEDDEEGPNDDPPAASN
jgi:hypothetical protein